MKISPLRILLGLSMLLLAAPLQAQNLAILEVSPILVDFNDIAVGGSARQNLTLTNLTSAPLNVTNFAQTGSESFAVDPIGGGKPCGGETPQLAANENCTLEVIFTPEFPEDAEGSLTFIPNDDPTKAISVRLQGSTADENGGCSLGGAVSAGASTWVGMILVLGFLFQRRFRN